MAYSGGKWIRSETYLPRGYSRFRLNTDRRWWQFWKPMYVGTHEEDSYHCIPGKGCRVPVSRNEIDLVWPGVYASEEFNRR